MKPLDHYARILVAIFTAAIGAVALGGFLYSHYLIQAPVTELETSLLPSLPRCFETSDVEAIARALTRSLLRCRPVIHYEPDDPYPRKLICMPAERMAEHGTIELVSPMLLLTVEQRCITAVKKI